MNNESETPFDNVESAQQFVELLCDAVEEARREVDADIERARGPEGDRRKQALQLVAYNLAKLSTHMTTSRRILNDLRSLRRLLLSERMLGKATVDSEDGSAPEKAAGAAA